MARDLSREPLTLETAKHHLGVRTDFRDEEIGRLIVAARERIETWTGRALVRREIVETFQSFASPFVLQFGPVHEILSMSYIDTAGDLAAFDSLPRAFGPIGNQWRLVPDRGERWPTLGKDGFVQVVYRAGFGPGVMEGEEADPVPASLEQAMLLLVGTWYENHEGAIVGTSAVELPQGVKDICRDLRPSGIA